MSPAVPSPAPDLDRLLGSDARRTPDMEAVWDWLVEQDVGQPDWLTLAPADARAVMDESAARWNAELPPVAAVEALTLPGAPPVAATLFTPPSAKPGCILYLHGGGWAVGSTRTHERLMRLLAGDAETRVLGIDYRLAPEHPYPAPFADCLAAWRALVANAGDPKFHGPLAVAGDSAGANLALAVALSEVAAGRRGPDAALLFYGAYATDLDTPSYRRFAEGYGLTRGGMARFWDWYAPAGTDRRDALVSPLEASEAAFARLPPLFLNAAGLDPLLCDTLRLAGRVRAAGVPHRLVVHEGVHHGFMQMSSHLPEARDAIRQAAGFLADLPGGPG